MRADATAATPGRAVFIILALASALAVIALVLALDEGELLVGRACDRRLADAAEAIRAARCSEWTARERAAHGKADTAAISIAAFDRELVTALR